MVDAQILDVHMYSVEYWHDKLQKWILLCNCTDLGDAIQQKLTYEQLWNTTARVTNKLEGVYVI